MSAHAITEALQKQKWIDAPAGKAHDFVRKTFDSTGKPGRAVESFLHGEWLGHSLHASITDVPIGSWTAAVVMDTVDAVRGKQELNAGADAALTLGIVGAAAAAVTGWSDYGKMRDPAILRIGAIHASMNVTALGLMSLSLLLRRRKRREAGRWLALLGFAVVIASAFLGGEMVYRQRAGIGPRG